jgi:hypothetical protein
LVIPLKEKPGDVKQRHKGYVPVKNGQSMGKLAAKTPHEQCDF